MVDWIIADWPMVIQGVLGACLFLAASIYLPILWGAPALTTPRRVAKRMLELAEVIPGQKVIDLGAGDGRIVILAARKFGAQAEGVEIDPARWLLANIRIWQLRLRGKAYVKLGDLRKYPLDKADVVILYLMQGTNQMLKAGLLAQLKPGARVVSHCYSMSGWTPTILDDQNRIFFYEVGRTGEETITKFR